MNKEIVLATNNKHKLQEFRNVLSPLGYLIYSPADLNIKFEADETGDTYRKNSYIKAKALSSLVPFPVIADDSGFEVEGLGNFPGIHSSRFVDEFAGDYEKAGLELNRRLGDNPNRNAKFHCCICLLENKDSKPLYFEADFQGKILPKKIGDGGFGYDPFFYSDELQLSVGIIDEHLKNKYSHRGKAIAKLAIYLSI